MNKMDMGMHKMGQGPDTAGGFMNPTITRKRGLHRRKFGMGGVRQDSSHAHMGMRQDSSHAHMGMRQDGGHGHMGMRQDGSHGHMGKMKAFMKGFMGNMRQNHMMQSGSLIPGALRRIGNACSGLRGLALGRCRAKVMGGCLSLMGQALLGCKAHRRKFRKRALGGSWILVKKNNGQCECVQNPAGQIVVGRFHSFKECDNHKPHDC